MTNVNWLNPWLFIFFSERGRKWEVQGLVCHKQTSPLIKHIVYKWRAESCVWFFFVLILLKRNARRSIPPLPQAPSITVDVGGWIWFGVGWLRWTTWFLATFWIPRTFGMNRLPIFSSCYTVIDFLWTNYGRRCFSIAVKGGRCHGKKALNQAPVTFRIIIRTHGNKKFSTWGNGWGRTVENPSVK